MTSRSPLALDHLLLRMRPIHRALPRPLLDRRSSPLDSAALT